MTHSKFKVHAHASPTQMDLAMPRYFMSGRLYIEVDGVYFPTEGWYDYVVPVLCWWIDNAMRLYLPDSEVKNICMDGPYTFYMRRSVGSDEVLLTLREDARSVTGQYTISYKRCLATFRGAAKTVLNELRELGVEEQGETSNLRSSLVQLERLESEIKARGLP